MPVVSMAREIPFQLATIEYFWRAVKGNRGSGGAGAGGSFGPTRFSPFCLLLPSAL